jgi:hypothetical protein
VDRRYGEVLLLHRRGEAIVADVYNSYGLNDCPQEPWSRLDAAQLAAEDHTLLAVFNARG